MRSRKWLFLAVPIGIVVFMFLGGEVVMHLWNWLLPALFGWRQIDFWQALGLLVLCRVLFGRLGGSPMNMRRRMGERWEGMTPEEREKFRQRMGGRCGFDSPGSSAEKPA